MCYNSVPGLRICFLRMGFSLALGALPKFVLSGKLNKVCRICLSELTAGNQHCRHTRRRQLNL